MEVACERPFFVHKKYILCSFYAFFMHNDAKKSTELVKISTELR